MNGQGEETGTAARAHPLAGRRVLITGGGRGIGRAIAAALTAQGAHVCIVGRTAETLHEAVAAGDAAAMQVADVTHADGVHRAFEALGGDFDIVVANAGAAETAPFQRTAPAQFQRALDINFFGFVHAAQAALPFMRSRRHGRIIAIASMASLKGYAYVSAYVAAKHAVLGLVRALALETAREGITVNAVCPGFTDTDMVRAGIETIVARTGRDAAAARAELVKSNPQGRLVLPEEVAAAVAWLASDAAASVTGQSIAIAGGES